ncbi:MAG: DNA-3-methyladenine glycosylase 2 family protein [Rhodocyclaceae bacterium]|nr:DNA-3-methyladenine glycosylase 2 family protein [Rhodocyclaceae bacterium]
MTHQINCEITLPSNYRPADALKFHARDVTGFSEIVRDTVIRKGLLFDGVPTLATIEIGKKKARCTLAFDAAVELDSRTCKALMRRLLGLVIDADSFEQAMQSHPELGPTIRAQTGLRLPMAATAFEALIWAVTGQQINLGVALQLRRRLIALTGLQHSSGVACHPDAQAVAKLTADQLGQAKFSRAKTQTILTVSQMVCAGELPLDEWQGEPINAERNAERINAQLLAIRGIGPWTANYTLLRGFGWADGSLHGDVAVRNSLQEILQQADKVSIPQAEQWLAQFSPWRSLTAAHLWARLAKTT